MDELVGLEDKADLAPAHRGQLRFSQIVDRHAIQPDFAFAGRVEAGKQAEQRALSTAACAHNRHKLSGRNLQRDPLQNFHASRAVLDPLLRALDLNQFVLPPLAVYIGRSYRLRSAIPNRTRLHYIRGRSARGSCRMVPPAFASWGRSMPPTGLSLSAMATASPRALALLTGQAYPDFLQKKLDALGYRYKVVNQGTSGATTKDALAGLPFVLRMHPAIVIVEFGGNDGLARTACRPDTQQSGPGADGSRDARRSRFCLPASRCRRITDRLHSLVRPDLSRSGCEAPRGTCSNALQEPGQCAGNHSDRRHPSHRERLGDHCRHAVSGAKAAVAQRTMRQARQQKQQQPGSLPAAHPLRELLRLKPFPAGYACGGQRLEARVQAALVAGYRVRVENAFLHALVET